ncbi:MAG TPA: polyprenyl diphosphate synthase [Candidatus Pacearchaeota archaeon]|nr:polyprenyl diphosphate synthase [Candidatus Pacearchaeota archaeon]HPR80053.1 polyprenyl diphosphate synthase [Candidatus Pacearchaeota archaeon]
MKIPNHVAIIPDGNRRWAKKRNLATFLGHEKGSDTSEKIIEKALEMKIPYLTIWGSSLDNILKRSKSEVNCLFKIFEKEFNKLAENENVHKNKVKVEVIGKWREYFPESTKKAIENTIKKTKNYDKYLITFLMAYNGTDEMIDCIKKIKEKRGEVNEKTIIENLWTKDLPPVDLLIRTGCENDPHLSAGFMMWHTAYSQLYFTNKYFPDFKEKQFEEAIRDYIERDRRKGS